MRIILAVTILILNTNNLLSYELSRDQVFESLLKDLSNKFIGKNKLRFRLVKDESENAFIIDNNYIFFTNGIFQNIEDANAVTSIMFHEYGHMERQHLFQKKKSMKQMSKYLNYGNIFSLLIGASLQNTEVVFGTSITLNETLIENFLQNSREFENEADLIMVNNMNKNKLNLNSTLKFLEYLKEDNNSNYRRTHPVYKERINLVKNSLKLNHEIIKDNRFDYLKAKLFGNSINSTYNNFFNSINSGVYMKLDNDEMQIAARYDLFKVGLNKKPVIEIYEESINKYNNSYIKLEFINYLIDNSFELLLDKKIKKFKINKEFKKEFFFHYIMGKYYNHNMQKDLANFYFCNFYKKIQNFELVDYYCNKYDENKISVIDMVNQFNDNTN